jgi:hypothetical protein
MKQSLLTVSIHTTSHYCNAASKDKLQSIAECRNKVCREKELVLSGTSIGVIRDINWCYQGHQLVLSGISIDVIRDINWCYQGHQLVLSGTSIGVFRGMNWCRQGHELVLSGA